MIHGVILQKRKSKVFRNKIHPVKFPPDNFRQTSAPKILPTSPAAIKRMPAILGCPDHSSTASKSMSFTFFDQRCFFSFTCLYIIPELTNGWRPKLDGLKNGDSFKIWPCFVSMLDFLGVTPFFRKGTFLKDRYIYIYNMYDIDTYLKIHINPSNYHHNILLVFPTSMFKIHYHPITFWYCCWFRNPKEPPGMYHQTLVNNGISITTVPSTGFHGFLVAINGFGASNHDDGGPWQSSKCHCHYGHRSTVATRLAPGRKRRHLWRCAAGISPGRFFLEVSEVNNQKLHPIKP